MVAYINTEIHIHMTVGNLDVMYIHVLVRKGKCVIHVYTIHVCADDFVTRVDNSCLLVL